MSYILYYIGHLISIPMNRFDLGWLYRYYNWCMLRSVEYQEKSGKGPWGPWILPPSLKKNKCNGFCGEYECNENQKKVPTLCKRLR